MWAFQMFTVFGVKEERLQTGVKEKTTLKGMLGVLAKNDQLMVAAVAMALFMIGYCTTTTFGVHYFKYAYKDEGTYMIFAAVLAVAQLTALVVFPIFSKHFTRRQLYFWSMIAVVVAYILFFFSFENIVFIVIAGLVLFFAQAFIQLLMLLFLADAVEYGEWKLGKRNESVSFAVQPFVNKLGGAAGQLVLTLTLAISGIDKIANANAPLEDQLTGADKITEAILQAQINANIDSVSSGAIWIMKVAMMILPLICILVGFIIYHKKFKIDEKMYEKIVSDLKERNGEAIGETDCQSASVNNEADDENVTA